MTPTLPGRHPSGPLDTKAAQIFYLKHGGPRYDPDRLDADHDGIACEDNPAPYYYGKRLP